MILHLVDTDPELVHYWTEAFESFPEVEIMLNDILDVAHDAIVSPANSYGHMDGGIDQSYIDYFGSNVQRRVYEAISRRPEGYLPVGASLIDYFGSNVQRRVYEAISRRPEGYLPVGASLVVGTEDKRIPYLIVAPTMLVPEPVPAHHSYRAMAAALRVAGENAGRIHDLYCPGLATGVGRVPFDEAAREMASAYHDWIKRTSGKTA